jgi:hypothetical protein
VRTKRRRSDTALLKCLLNEQGCIAACRRIAAEVYACSIMVEVLGATRYIAATGGAAFFQQHNNDVLDFNSVDTLGGYQDV